MLTAQVLHNLITPGLIKTRDKIILEKTLSCMVSYRMNAFNAHAKRDITHLSNMFAKSIQFSNQALYSTCTYASFLCSGKMLSRVVQPVRRSYDMARHLKSAALLRCYNSIVWLSGSFG